MKPELSSRDGTDWYLPQQRVNTGEKSGSKLPLGKPSQHISELVSIADPPKKKKKVTTLSVKPSKTLSMLNYWSTSEIKRKTKGTAG